VVDVLGPVLVAGAGIAGLAMLRALRRYDIPTSAVEQRSTTADTGLAINIPGNGVRALAALGLDDRLHDLGAPVDRREYRNARGRLLFSVAEREFWNGQGGSRCVRRNELTRLLMDGLPPDTVHNGQTVAAVENTPESVHVSLADGTTTSAGFVIGADGVRSAVRGGTFGADGRRSAVLSTASWRFMAPNPGVDCWTVWAGAHGTFLLIPVDHDEVYGFASASRGDTVSADPDWLHSTFATYPEPVRSVLGTLQTRPQALYHSPIEEVRIERWTRGRTALIGDAAHATAPVWAQGAALAAEDALVLARLLGENKDWTTVGAEYERLRRPRVAHVQAMTDRLSKTAGLPTWLRDLMLPVVGPHSYRSTYEPLKVAVA
jgi:2-polyprenyl-6-methoxyphenol hydroxylase-like FAD-dependent oxidoreductase